MTQFNAQQAFGQLAAPQFRDPSFIEKLMTLLPQFLAKVADSNFEQGGSPLRISELIEKLGPPSAQQRFQNDAVTTSIDQQLIQSQLEALIKSQSPGSIDDPLLPGKLNKQIADLARTQGLTSATAGAESRAGALQQGNLNQQILDQIRISGLTSATAGGESRAGALQQGNLNQQDADLARTQGLINATAGGESRSIAAAPGDLARTESLTQKTIDDNARSAAAVVGNEQLQVAQLLELLSRTGAREAGQPVARAQELANLNRTRGLTRATDSSENRAEQLLPGQLSEQILEQFRTTGQIGATEGKESRAQELHRGNINQQGADLSRTQALTNATIGGESRTRALFPVETAQSLANLDRTKGLIQALEASDTRAGLAAPGKRDATERSNRPPSAKPGDVLKNLVGTLNDQPQTRAAMILLDPKEQRLFAAEIDKAMRVSQSDGEADIRIADLIAQQVLKKNKMFDIIEEGDIKDLPAYIQEVRKHMTIEPNNVEYHLAAEQIAVSTGESIEVIVALLRDDPPPLGFLERLMGREQLGPLMTFPQSDLPNLRNPLRMNPEQSQDQQIQALLERITTRGQ